MKGLWVEILEFLLFPYVVLFYFYAKVRRLFWRIRGPRVQLPCRVISVGNITSGGTGKSALVMDLVRVARKRGQRVAVVSRAYKAEQRTPTKVNPFDPRGAALFGDEALMIARQFPEVPVYVGASKSETAASCFESEKPDLIFVDDGFQHLQLHRDCDIVLLDDSAPAWHYLYLPFGRLRENLSAMESAHVVVVTKTRFANSPWRPWMKAVVSKTPLYFMDYAASELTELQTGEIRLLNTLKSDKVLLVTGLAAPVIFEKMVRQDLSVDVRGHVIFRDHHSYTDKDIQKIESEFETLGCDMVLTTAKDAVKLKGRLSVPCFVVELKKDLKGAEELFQDVAR